MQAKPKKTHDPKKNPKTFNDTETKKRKRKRKHENINRDAKPRILLLEFPLHQELILLVLFQGRMNSSSSSSSAIKEIWVIYFTPSSATKKHSFPTRPWQAQPEFTGELRETSTEKQARTSAT
jgi:hypothetical protein